MLLRRVAARSFRDMYQGRWPWLDYGRTFGARLRLWFVGYPGPLALAKLRSHLWCLSTAAELIT
jgi:hypothetical protein